MGTDVTRASWFWETFCQEVCQQVPNPALTLGLIFLLSTVPCRPPLCLPDSTPTSQTAHSTLSHAIPTTTSLNYFGWCCAGFWGPWGKARTQGVHCL